MKNVWTSAYFFYAEPWENFLSKTVHPFIQNVMKEKLADQFFFIRYWEKGPHIRLRFKGEDNIIEKKLKPYLTDYFTDFFKARPSQRYEPEWIKQLPPEKAWFPNNSIQWVDYEPEIERYSGQAGILIAEKQFEISSKVVLSIIEENRSWSYDSALGAAVQLHLGFAYAMGMSLYEAKYFFSVIAEGWMSSAVGHSLSAENFQEKKNEILKVFEEHFNKQQSELIPFQQTLWEALIDHADFEQAWLNDWLHGMKGILTELNGLYSKNKLIFPKSFRINDQIDVPSKRQLLWSIWTSYIHMTNNRLGIQNQDEAFLGYLLKRSLEIWLSGDTHCLW
ncbi:hypothetical protein K1X84_00975 [bacterium]|nr:hypothetical protein [bacterium]